jgi:hypothetical protein
MFGGSLSFYEVAPNFALCYNQIKQMILKESSNINVEVIIWKTKQFS